MGGRMRLLLRSHTSYRNSFKTIVQNRLEKRYGNNLSSMSTADLAADQGSLLELSHLDRIEDTPPHQHIVYDSSIKITGTEKEYAQFVVMQGLFFTEHTVGGNASRLNESAQHVSFGQKFFIPPEKMIAETNITGFGRLLPFTLGERHMLQQAFGIYQLARETGADHWTDVLARQKTLIVPNTEGEKEILDVFKKFGFFGFAPENVMFSSSRFYPGLVLENGVLREHEDIKKIHNHGIVPMQLGMEDSIFTIDEKGIKTNVPRYKFRQMLRSMRDKVSLNVEDLGYITNPNDFRGLAIALKMGQRGYRMIMEILKQKEKPQKGGKLGFDPELYDPIQAQMGRCVVIESFQLGLPSEKLDNGSENPAYTKALKRILYLNRNCNHHPIPIDSFDVVADGGLPIHIEVKKTDGGQRVILNATPQGDINFLVPTYYIIKDQPLSNLKTVADLKPTLEAFRKQDEQPGFKAFVANFVPDSAQIVPDYTFDSLNRLSEIEPLDLKAFNAHPWFTARADKTAREKLTTSSEIFHVEGSIIYETQIKGKDVYVKVIPGSKRGTALTYPSQAEKQVEAKDAKRRAVLGNKIWTGLKKIDDRPYSYILISNHKEGEKKGELIMLLGSYKEDVPDNRKLHLLSSRLNVVIEFAINRNVPDEKRAKMKEEFKKLSWQFLNENSAETIEKELEKRLGIKNDS